MMSPSPEDHLGHGFGVPGPHRCRMLRFRGLGLEPRGPFSVRLCPLWPPQSPLLETTCSVLDLPLEPMFSHPS